MLDAMAWWTGVVVWGVVGVWGALELVDFIIDRVLAGMGLKREFLQWVWDRYRHRRDGVERRKPAD